VESRIGLAAPAETGSVEGPAPCARPPARCPPGGWWLPAEQPNTQQRGGLGRPDWDVQEPTTEKGGDERRPRGKGV
jgi:hypothetical protein